MNQKQKNHLFSIIAAGIWITFSEFARNELVFKQLWVEHFNSLGLKFTTLPINGILWTTWSFIFAYLIYQLVQKFSVKKTLFLSWLGGFVLMWITTYNLQVFPRKLLLPAIPLSFLEISIAVLIFKKCPNNKKRLTKIIAK